ncbi:charged multivesicular body protein 7 [Chelonus insularis]|uniref:charged multivesicular body protein 7 n=1 Tax=Chelonus insularis TaxID=460826 RepID=UPI00158862D2|nr:charged multivesicular body protein 7 [Chelonus insularis]
MNKTVIYPLPQDILPQSWFQDERMNAMFAEFRSHSVNSQDWNAKYQFWKELIFKWLSYNKKCQFSISELTFAFKRNGIIPRCLTTVIEQLIKSNQIITQDEFYHQLYNSNASWTSWTVNIFIKKPFFWSLSKVKNILNVNNHSIHNNPDTIKYIHYEIIHELANDILDFTKENDPIILSYYQILQRCTKEKNIDESNAKLALTWINRMKNNNFIIIFDQISSESLLKISSTKGIENLSKYEEGLFQLTQCEKSILKTIQNLEMEKNSVMTEIQNLIKNNNGLSIVNMTVKTLLRKKKQIERRIEKQTAIFDNIQVLISNIHDAKSNSEIFETYKKSTELLKNFKLSSLQVQNTMDDLYEVVDELNETQLTLSESCQLDESINSELEEEFKNLFIDTSNKLVHTETTPQVESSDNNDLHFPPVPDTLIPSLVKEKDKSLAQTE